MGLIEAISKSSNTTVHTSGTVWSASILKGMMTNNWDNSNGDVATDVYMGSYLKDITDDFSNKTGITWDGVGEKKIISSVDIFETGLGKVAVHPHRYVQISSDATARVLAIRPEKLRVAYMKRPFIDTDLARLGDYDFRAVAGKMTCEVRNQESNWFTSGFAKS